MRYFNGRNKTKCYFEGWYLKHRKGEQAISLIPAFHIDEDGEKRASIQVVMPGRTYTAWYPAEEFHADVKRFRVKVGNNIFSKVGCRVDVDTPDIKVKGKIRYGRFHSLASDIMGPFCYMPGMQCRHGVLSMRHRLKGALKIQNEDVDFDGGTGYIETDRGSSFPTRYIWVQCEETGGVPISIMVSIADIPVLSKSFVGCICAVCCGNKEYRLATYRNVKVKRWDRDGIYLTQGKYQFLVQFGDCGGQPLQAPCAGRMDRVIEENLLGSARFRFWEKGELVFDILSEHVSLEQEKAL